ncbi:MAG: APC family permease [Clostridia bacterium]|nr:APC family permease [Clostridia bacterium]
MAKGRGTGSVSSAPAQKTSGGNPFKQTLTVFDMVIYGLISMVPIAPMAIYGSVFEASGGMPALAYVIGFTAVLFSVFSFAIMIRTFPSSGSIYTYASHIMGRAMGFLTGWLMLLQYLITPTLMYIIGGTALHGFLPDIPVWVFCLIFWVLVAFISLRGMKATVKVNRIALVGELVVLGLFTVMGLYYVLHHPETGGLSAKAFIDPDKFNFGDMMSSVSLAVLSYVGFGVIATLTQEAKNERQGPPRAMMIMALILLVLFAGQCYIATCIDPSGSSFAHNTNNGFYEVAKMVGGQWLSVLCAVAVALAQGLFTALVGQTSVSLILFSMAKGGSLPKKLGTLKKGTNLPLTATIFVMVLSLVLIFVMLPMGMDSVAKVSNFGALATYGILNVCVIVYCWFQKKERRHIFRHLVFPLLGAAICFVILFSLSDVALLVGAVWLGAGIVYYLVLKYGLHRTISLS